MSCRKCKQDIIRYVEKKSFQTIKERVSDNSHFHYGVPYFRYGICRRLHMTKFKMCKVIWDPCIKCKFKGVVTNYRLPKTPEEQRLEEIKELRREIEDMKAMKDEFDQLKKTIQYNTIPTTLDFDDDDNSIVSIPLYDGLDDDDDTLDREKAAQVAALVKQVNNIANTIHSRDKTPPKPTRKFSKFKRPGTGTL